MPNQEKGIKRSEEPQRSNLFFNPRKFVLIIVLLSITSCLCEIKPVSSRTILVPTEYESIQAAVDNATAGDTIQVAPGIYYEHVYVNKSLTIAGENQNHNS
jgi:nitrous oxidase accessory protein NosD